MAKMRWQRLQVAASPSPLLLLAYIRRASRLARAESPSFALPLIWQTPVQKPSEMLKMEATDRILADDLAWISLYQLSVPTASFAEETRTSPAPSVVRVIVIV